MIWGDIQSIRGEFLGAIHVFLREELWEFRWTLLGKLLVAVHRQILTQNFEICLRLSTSFVLLKFLLSFIHAQIQNVSY